MREGNWDVGFRICDRADVPEVYNHFCFWATYRDKQPSSKIKAPSTKFEFDFEEED
jgi:hypothetical protein